MIAVQLSQFSGPLDILLSLIQEKKIHITEISLSEVTEQYLHYVEQLDDSRAHELADFLTVASQLLVLKAKRLLPDFFPDEEESGPSLEEQLRLYKQFVDASKDIQKRWLAAYGSHGRIEPPRASETFIPPGNATKESLYTLMHHIIERRTPPKALPSVRIDKTVSIKEKIASIQEILKKVDRLFLHDMYQGTENKTDMIMAFLAVLELVKQESVALSQSNIFGDILLTRV